MAAVSPQLILRTVLLGLAVVVLQVDGPGCAVAV